MGGLTAFQPKTETVELPGGATFAVRGLALEDVSVLLRDHYDTAVALFDKYVAEAAAHGIDQTVTGGETGLGDIRGIAAEVFQHAPSLIGDVITRAADEHENPHLARLLPLGVQIDAIEKTVRLTLEAEGGLEKLVESVTKLATTLMTAVGADGSP